MREKIINYENSGIETKCPNLYSEDIDKNLRNVNNCKYYTIDGLQSSKDIGNFNIFHNNLNRLENKFEVLHNFLTGAPKTFDIMAITETSQKLVNEDFKTNISMEGYLTFSTPTNTNKVEQRYMLTIHLTSLKD